jgi:hypothetical protein
MSFSISALITNRALCRNCIGQQVGMKPEAVETVIKVMGRGGMKIDHYPHGTCLDCGNDGLVFAIDRP